MCLTNIGAIHFGLQARSQVLCQIAKFGEAAEWLWLTLRTEIVPAAIANAANIQNAKSGFRITFIFPGTPVQLDQIATTRSIEAPP